MDAEEVYEEPMTGRRLLHKLQTIDAQKNDKVPASRGGNALQIRGLREDHVHHSRLVQLAVLHQHRVYIYIYICWQGDARQARAHGVSGSRQARRLEVERRSQVGALPERVSWIPDNIITFLRVMFTCNLRACNGTAYVWAG